MKRLLIIGATVVALSTTAVVAWAGTGPAADIGSHIGTQTRGQDIDPIVMKVLDRIQKAWQWQGHDGGDRVADRAHQVADPMRDATHERDVEAIHDAVDQVRDRAHEVADPVRDVVHGEDMVRDRDATQGRDMVEGHIADQRSNHESSTVHDQNMDQDWNMDRSTGQDHMGSQGRMDR